MTASVNFPQVNARGVVQINYEVLTANAFHNAHTPGALVAPFGDNIQLWDIVTDQLGFTGTTELTLEYDELLLHLGFDEADLGLWHFDAGADQWHLLPVLAQDPLNNTITVAADTFSPFALGAAIPVPAAAGPVLLLLAGTLRTTRGPRRAP